MASRSREVKVAFLGDVSGLKRAIAEGERSMDGFQGHADRASSGMSGAFSRIGSGASAAAMGIAAAGAGVVAAFGGMVFAGKKFADSATDYGLSVGKIERQTGMAADQASLFAYAAQQTGVDVDSLGKAVKAMSKNMVDGDKAWFKLGIATHDARGNMRPMYDVLADVADQFSKMEDGPEKTALAVELFGRSGMDLIPMLNQGKGGLIAYADEMEKFGLKLDEAGVEKAREAKRAQRDLEAAWQGLTVQIGMALLPAFTAVSNWLRDTLPGVVAAVRPWIEGVGRWFTDIKTAWETAGWSGVWDKLKGDLAGAWENTIKPALERLPGQIGEWVKTTGIPALGNALAGLRDAFSGWIDQIWNDQGEGDNKREGLSTRIGNLFRTIGQKIDEMTGPDSEFHGKVTSIGDRFNEWTNHAAEKTPEALNKTSDAMDRWAGGEGAQRTAAMGGALAGSLLKGFYEGLLAVDLVILKFADTVSRAIADPRNWVAALSAIWRIGWDIVKLLATGIANAIDTLLSDVPDWIKSALGLTALSNDLRNFVDSTSPGGGGPAMPTAEQTRAHQGRALGGPVTAGRPYLVGERGPELFVPGISGTIVPNGAGNTYNIYANQLDGAQAAAFVAAHERAALVSAGAA